LAVSPPTFQSGTLGAGGIGAGVGGTTWSLGDGAVRSSAATYGAGRSAKWYSGAGRTQYWPKTGLANKKQTPTEANAILIRDIFDSPRSRELARRGRDGHCRIKSGA
jgi:hypothetical protein